ncbi:hypothetical protein PVL29_019977 [Vitis rotundifolia]|uniref:Uncharacterized protein n=1 Tax=Vitis rotundifolia TaxID=103349 RepID=A0AA38Z206_VITRO|nr:hypothetical protein PVL29_019977 [Vitis rotundifolia]
MELLNFSPCKISHIAKSASLIRYSREEFWNVSNHLGSCNRSEPTIHPSQLHADQHHRTVSTTFGCEPGPCRQAERPVDQ